MVRDTLGTGGFSCLMCPKKMHGYTACVWRQNGQPAKKPRDKKTDVGSL